MLILDSESSVEDFILGAWLRGLYNVREITRVLVHHSERPSLYKKPGRYELRRAVSQTIQRSRAQASKDRSGFTWNWSEKWSWNKKKDRKKLRAIERHMEEMLKQPLHLPPSVRDLTSTLAFIPINDRSIVRPVDPGGRAISLAPGTASAGPSKHTEHYSLPPASGSPLFTSGNLLEWSSPPEIKFNDIDAEFDKLDGSNEESITKPYIVESPQTSIQGLHSSKDSSGFFAEDCAGAHPACLFDDRTLGTPTNESPSYSSYLGPSHDEAYFGPLPSWNHSLADTNFGLVTFPGNSFTTNNEKSIVNPVDEKATITTVKRSKDFKGGTEVDYQAWYLEHFHAPSSAPKGPPALDTSYRKVPTACGHSNTISKKKKVATQKRKYRNRKKGENVSVEPQGGKALAVHGSGFFGEGDLEESKRRGMIKDRRCAVIEDDMTLNLESSREKLRQARNAIMRESKQVDHQQELSEANLSSSKDEGQKEVEPEGHCEVTKKSAVKDYGIDTTAVEHAIVPCAADAGYPAEHTIGHADPNHDGESLFRHALQALGIFEPQMRLIRKKFSKYRTEGRYSRSG
ncbi:MAG: hypothetical protein LQ352_006244 [Teloschistes flavicans]|nr:MAG: hypothetical protein LQ352_006244 [Teloschistes flavicans]